MTPSIQTLYEKGIPMAEYDETVEEEGNAVDSAPRPFIVIHANSHGAVFATRVSAHDEDDAEMAVSKAHSDNTIEDVFGDSGGTTVPWGTETFPVVDLDMEP